MKIRYGSICNIGAIRKMNQDTVLCKQYGDKSIFMVADGMGGHSYGERASETVRKELEEWWNNLLRQELQEGFSEIVFSLKQKIELINRHIYEKYNQNAVCGTTMVLLFCMGERYALMSVGDSRAYYGRYFQFRQLTIDDVWENQAEVLSEPKESRNLIEHMGKLTAAVGIRENLDIHIQTSLIRKKDSFMLCSDGVYKMCSDRKLRRLLMRFRMGANQKIVLDEMAQTIYNNGAKDNFTAIIVHIS